MQCLIPNSISTHSKTDVFGRDRNSHSPNAVAAIALLDGRTLTPQRVDRLTEAQSDWISILQEHWKIDLFGLNLSHLSSPGETTRTNCVTPEEFIDLTRQKRYRSIEVLQQHYWTYSCCTSVVGLGRVRLVVVTNTFNQPENSAVFVTNRLNWSAQTILARWFEQPAATSASDLIHVSTLEVNRYA